MASPNSKSMVTDQQYDLDFVIKAWGAFADAAAFLKEFPKWRDQETLGSRDALVGLIEEVLKFMLSEMHGESRRQRA